MNINYIKEFVILADTGNFHQCADNLFISQSSLSKHIKSLETSLGVSLFDRTSRKVVLSEFGEIFLPYAKQIISIQNSYTNDFNKKLSSLNNSITIGTEYRIIELISDFHKEINNNCSINIIESNNSNEIKNMLKSDKCDLAFLLQTNNSSDEFNSLLYNTDTLVAVLPSDHPLSKRKSVSLTDLINENFILLPEDSIDNHIFKNACMESGFNPKIAFTGFKGSTIVNFIKEKMGISILFKNSAKYIDCNGVSFIDISPSISVNIVICYKKNTRLSPAVKKFLNFIDSLN